MARERLQHGHADRHAHLHLLADDASRVVGDVGVDLDAAVHRTRMHDECVRLGSGELVVVEAEEVKIFAGARHQTRGHALTLKPQHHDDIGIGQAVPHRGIDLDAEPFDAGGEQRRRRDDADAGAERVEQQDVGPRHAGVKNVAADGDDQALDVALVAADGERVEQSLRRMLVASVPRVDHGAIDLLRQQLDRARRMMAHYEDVRAHGVERHRRVDQGLALLYGRRAHRHVHDVGP